MNSGKVLLGVVAGAAIGAMLGILFAPDKGSETRKKVLKKGGELKDGLEEKFNGLIDRLNRKFESVKEATSQIVENGKHNADGIIDEMTPPVN